MNVVGREGVSRLFQASLLLCLILMASLAGVSPVRAQGVPVVIYGYVHMPDGSPAAGATVSATCDSDSGSTTTNSQGYYQITLSIEGSQTVKVVARKGDLSAVKYVNVDEGTGKKEVNLTLKSESGGGGGGGGWTGGGGVSFIKILEISAKETALGDLVELKIRVLNEGDRPAGDVQALIYLEDWTLLDTVSVGTAIPAGSEKTIRVRFDSTLLGEGTHHIIVVLVTSQGSAKAEVDVVVVSRAVLELYLIAPQRVLPGQDVWVNGTVRNVGKVAAQGVKVRVTLDGRAAASAYLGDIPPGQVRDFSLLVRVPENVTGSVRLEVVVTGRPDLEVREVRTLTAASAAGGVAACAAVDLSPGREAIASARAAAELALNLTGEGEELERLAELEGLLGGAEQEARRGNCSGAEAILGLILTEAGEIAEQALSRAAEAVVREADALESTGDPRALATADALRAILEAYEAAEDVAVRTRLLLSASRLISAARAALATPAQTQVQGGQATPRPEAEEPESPGLPYSVALASALASAIIGAALGALISKRRS